MKASTCFSQLAQLLCAVALIASSQSTLFAQSAIGLPARTVKIVDEAVEQQMRQQKAVGAAIGIIQRGKVVYIKGYGFEDREKAIPVTSRTMFRWASISKTLTAYAAMQLVQEGKLDLDADIRKLVPEFPNKGVKITARDLLCHQGGIVHYSNGKVIRSTSEYEVPYPFEDVVTALDKFKESPLIGKPGNSIRIQATHTFC